MICTHAAYGKSHQYKSVTLKDLLAGCLGRFPQLAHPCGMTGWALQPIVGRVSIATSRDGITLHSCDRASVLLKADSATNTSETRVRQGQAVE